MKLGLQLNRFDWPGGPQEFGTRLAEIGRAAEAAGLFAIGVADHVWQHPIMGGPEADEPECYTTHAFLAAHTEKVALMALVSGVHLRHPAMLAKTVTMLDVLSGGRAWLGVGSGHYEEEARGLGIPFPPQKERFERLEETLRICAQMWTGERGDEKPFHGEHYRMERALNLPQSLSRPHPPVLIAGEGEKKTLRLVARYADACNLRPGPHIPGKLEVLERYCEEEGTDYDAIEKTCMFGFDVGEDGEKADELVEKLAWLSGMGIETVFGSGQSAESTSAIEIIGNEVVPKVAEMKGGT